MPYDIPAKMYTLLRNVPAYFKQKETNTAQRVRARHRQLAVKRSVSCKTRVE